MYKQLRSYLIKPKLYEKTSQLFWNDPHISKSMLEAHLNPNTNAASRKPAFIDASVEWLKTLMTMDTQLLDIGCGPGLYTKRLSDAGYNVSGLDFSIRSIEYAKSQDSKTKYIHLSYLEMDFTEQYDLITLIWCDYGALVYEDRVNLLKRVHQALKPGGRFILDVFSDSYHQKLVEKTSFEVCENGGFFSESPYISLNSLHTYEPNVSSSRYVVVEEELVKTYNIWNTCFSRESIKLETESVGFKLVSIYSDVCGKEFSTESDTLCVTLRK